VSAERITPGTNTWNEHYFEHAQRYRFFAHLCKGKRVLDAACGVGYGSKLLADSGAASVTGVDISAEAIATARKEFSDPKVTFLESDVTSLQLEGEPAEVAISFETIEHIQNPAELVASLKRNLAPGGLLVCSSPNILTHSGNPAAPIDNPHHLSETTYAEFRDLICAEFEVVEKFFQNPSPTFLFAQQLQSLSLAVTRSKLLGLENTFRRLLGKETLALTDTELLMRSLQNSTSVIEPLDDGDTNWQQTFILVARHPG
jgi:2-polyprenyl-3-methyl-5-hydroxy-6-metoxy-1,4-benzoquinol methylase